MSRELQYAASCHECGRAMRSGTIVDFFEDGKGNYRYIHAGTCEQAPVVEERPKRGGYDLRECGNTACYGAVGYGFAPGAAPPRCHLCGSEWAAA